MLLAMAWPRSAVVVIAPLVGVVLIAEIAAVSVAGQLGDRVYAGVSACITTTTIALAILVSRRQPNNAVAPLLACMALLSAVNHSHCLRRNRTRC